MQHNKVVYVQRINTNSSFSA